MEIPISMKQICLTLFSVFFISIISIAQDEPCSAIALDCNAEPVNGNFDGATFNSAILPTGCPAGQSSNSEGDIWFTFEADGEQGHLFYSDLNGQDPDHYLVLYTGTDCSNLTKIRDCQTEESFHEVFPAGTYYAQVAPRSNSIQDNSYIAGVLCSPVPENDTRCNAAPVSCGSTYTGSFIGSSRTEFVQCACNTFDVGDVWFEIEAEIGVTYNILGKPGQNIEIFEATSCTGALSQSSLCCLDQDIMAFSGAGTYYIYARPQSLSNSSFFNFELSVECTTPPNNDLPCNAIEVECSAEPILSTTVNAGSNVFSCLGGGTGTPPMVWYKYTSDFEGTMELYLCGIAPSFNATASIYTGSCDELVCYDAGGGCISGPESFDVFPGQEYFFAIHGFGGSFEGEFSLTFQCEEEGFCLDLDGFVGDVCDDGDFLTENALITSDCECIGNPIPPGALCENAIPIIQNPFFTNYFNPSESLNPSYYYSFDDIPPFLDSLQSDDVSFSCYQANGVVYSFSLDEDRLVDITVGNWIGVEPTITILTGCPFTTAHISKGCNSDDILTKKIENFYAVANTTYYILIDGKVDFAFLDLDVRFLMEVKLKKICPGLGAQFDSCDDGNPQTEDDVITGDCECLGTISQSAFCSGPLEVTPGPGLKASPILFDASDAVPSLEEYCDGSNEERADSWFSFEAVTTNMAIGVNGLGDYDAVLEVYDECGGNRIKCRNGGAEGQRETVLISDCIVGETYLFRVYERGGNTLVNNSFRASVTFFPIAQLEESDCNQGTFMTSDVITAVIPEFEYGVTKWTYEFTEQESPFNVYEVVSPNGSNPNFQLSQFAQIEEGRNYSLRVKASVLNLQIDGDYGNACEISVVGINGIGISQNERDQINADYSFEMYPNPNDGNEVMISLQNIERNQNKVRVSIYDFVGKLVLNEQIGGIDDNTTFNVPLIDLAKGIYIVKLNVNEKPLEAKKLIIK